jgi:small-conductance mechanosensitive channel
LLEDLKYWFAEHPTSTNIIKYVFWILLIVIFITWLKRFFKRKLPDTGSVNYKAQKGIEIIGYIFVVLITITYFTGSIKDFGLAIGLLTAGITITLQELILSIAGSFYIFLVKVYKPGDRIEINGIKGDVINVDSIYTTMMEIGEWVSSDNYSGRIVKLSNSFVFKGPVYNYSSDFPFVWDEINLPVRYGSDLELAKSTILKIAHDNLSEYVRDSMHDWKAIVAKYYVEDALVEPSLAITLNENWIQFNLRYIVDYKKRRLTKSILNQEIEKQISATQGKVTIAPSAYEIVKIPLINQNDQKAN